MNLEDKMLGSLFGLCVGDALGAPVEFKAKGTYPHISTYLPGGEFNLKAGQWTDDTSLALCIVDSINKKNEFDINHQAEQFINWWKNGYLSSTGFCFDIGNTTKASLQNILDSHNPLGGRVDNPATNGAIMRLAPVPIYFYQNLNKTYHYSKLNTLITHGAEESIEASLLLSYIIHMALQGKSKNEILRFHHFEPKLYTKIALIKNGNFKSIDENILDGKGLAYNTLLSAVYAFYHFDNFIDGLIFCVNLGDDTDTVGAVYGQMAGSLYGQSSIPNYYLENLYDYNLLNTMFRKFLENVYAKN